MLTVTFCEWIRFMLSGKYEGRNKEDFYMRHFFKFTLSFYKVGSLPAVFVLADG